MHKTNIGIYPTYFEHYISLVKEHTVIDGLYQSLENIETLFQSISDEKMEERYAPEKWTIKELLLHIMDAERIFCYRALSIARGEKNSMIGFDENEYAKHAHAEMYSREKMIHDYFFMRKNTIALFESFSPSVYLNIGIANNNEVSLTAIGFAILGHELHHIQILGERYGVLAP